MSWRLLRWVLCAMACCVVTWSAGVRPASAAAKSTVTDLVAHLKYPPPPGKVDDFRVRASAALALSSSGSDAAVEPLCSALNDPSPAVRSAAALSLRRLGRNPARSLACLRARQAFETVEGVKLQLSRALSGLTSASVTYVSTAKVYVAFSNVTNRTSRDAPSISRIVYAAMGGRLGATRRHQLATPGESYDAAKATIARRGLKGYYLAISVDEFRNTDEGLSVKVAVAVWTYPSRSLVASEVSTSGVLPGAKKGNRIAEDRLLSEVAAAVASLFDGRFAQ